MPLVWTIEKLAVLAPEQLENVRRNALARNETALAEMCKELQVSRSHRSTSPNSREPVVGFHFVCKNDYEVILEGNGSFRSGVWAVDGRLCDVAIELGGYVALHDSKANQSYRQGRIVDWTLKPRTKGNKEMGVEFLLSPIDTPFRWYGGGSGEKGYRRTTDHPAWEAK